MLRALVPVVAGDTFPASEQSLMRFNSEKFKTLVRYIAWKAGRRDWFGATKLNKVLWFADARQFVLQGKPITGATYIRENFGPVPKQLMPVRAELEREGHIRVFKEGDLIRVVADEKPDLSLFTPDELQTVDYWIKHIDEEHTAASISEATHDYAWELARMGEEVPFHAILANRIRDPNDRESEKFQTNKLGFLGWAG